MTVAYVDTAFLENAGVLLEDLLAGKPTPRPVSQPVQKARLTTAGALLKDAAPSSAEKLQALYAERKAHLGKMRFGFGEGDRAQWRLKNPTPAGQTAKSDDEVTSQLRAELQNRGTELARLINQAEVEAEVAASLAREDADRSARRASLTADQEKSLVDAIKLADAEVQKIADRSTAFEDRWVGNTDSLVANRRSEIASAHGQASERAFAARREAASYGLSA
jgi:hypothetical protein